MSNHQREISVRMLTIDQDSENRRLDNFLITLLKDIPHSHIYNIIRTGQVRVNKGRAKPKQRLKSGDIVRVPPVRTAPKPQPKAVGEELRSAVQSIIYEDDHLIVIDKPTGIAVHAGSKHNVALIEAIRVMRSNETCVELVHRLDKETSGILVLAKSKSVLRKLHVLWRRESDDADLTKTYIALVKGFLNKKIQTVESPPVELTKRNLQNSRTAPSVGKSTFRTLERFSNCSLASIELHTGKTHQARQHAQLLNNPIAGDRKYGDREFNASMHKLELNRMFLHASKLSIRHPVTGKMLDLESKLPIGLSKVLDRIRLSSTDS